MVEVASERKAFKQAEGLRIRRLRGLAGGENMWDIGCIGASILFFYIAIGYAMGCDRLKTKERQG